MFEREDWTFFRELGKLSQKAGVPLRSLPSVVLKELIDNALDAAGPEGLKTGKLGNGFYVQDAGPGLDGDDDAIAALFSINRPLSSTKLLRLPTRGALGNGLRVVAGAVLASGGTLQVSTRGRVLLLVPQDETGLTIARPLNPFPYPGTRIVVQLGPGLPVGPEVLSWAQLAAALARGESSYKGKTSPYWYDSDSFYELLRAATDRTVVDVIGTFDGCTHPKPGRIAREFSGRTAASLDRDEADRLLSRARDSSKPVSHKRLGCLGQDVPGLPAYHALTHGELPLRPGRGSIEGLVPFVLEVWAEVADTAAVGISVNRTPITADVRAHYDPKAMEIGVISSGLEAWLPAGKKPIRLHINIDTPFMPITGDGKAPDLNLFHDLIAPTITKAINRAKLSHRYSKPPEAAKATQKGVILANLDAAVSKAGDGGKLRYSLRQLFYAVRPHVIEAMGTQPKYDYFCKVITEYENSIGRDLLGIYRDSRGTLYHPHTGQVIPLGTLNVERYTRHPYIFNKILYSEKEGFFEVLRDVNWPERNDCALMTSKGFASRAARDVLDLLGETGEPLTFYCIHDADASGTMIHQALQEGTKARPGRKVEIVNLGLEPAEAIGMGLQVEDASNDDGKFSPVAGYVPPEWAEWLQKNRVELNAMTTSEFLAWLDSKFGGAGGKVVPPPEILADRLEGDVREELNRSITRDLLLRGDLSGRVEKAFRDRRGAIQESIPKLDQGVRDGLRINPVELWAGPVVRVARVIAGANEMGE